MEINLGWIHDPWMDPSEERVRERERELGCDAMQAGMISAASQAWWSATI